MKYLLTLLPALASPAFAEPLVFEERIEISERAVLSSLLNGVVAESLCEVGDPATGSQPLIRLDPRDLALALESAEARPDRAARRTTRQQELHDRRIADATPGPARTEIAMADAAFALTAAERKRAALDLQRASWRATNTGHIWSPAIAVGIILQATIAPSLSKIVSLDPALVACRAPYAERLESLETTGSRTVADLLENVRVGLRLPGDKVYPGTATPHAASAEVDAETGTVTVWARFPNPEALLRPGVAVSALSRIGEPEAMR